MRKYQLRKVLFKQHFFCIDKINSIIFKENILTFEYSLNLLNYILSSFVAGKVMVNNANVQEADLSVTNGVIHVIDTVLLPPSILQHL